MPDDIKAYWTPFPQEEDKPSTTEKVGRGIAALLSRVGGAGLGTIAGGAIGALGGPLAPVTVPAGALLGGAVGGGGGEALAEKIESGEKERKLLGDAPINKGHVAVGAVTGAIPGSWMVRSGKPLVSAGAGALMSAGTMAADKAVDGQNPLDPHNYSATDALKVAGGAVIGGLFGKLTSNAPRKLPTETVSPEVTPTGNVIVPDAKPIYTDKSGAVKQDKGPVLMTKRGGLTNQAETFGPRTVAEDQLGLNKPLSDVLKTKRDPRFTTPHTVEMEALKAEAQGNPMLAKTIRETAMKTDTAGMPTLQKLAKPKDEIENAALNLEAQNKANEAEQLRQSAVAGGNASSTTARAVIRTRNANVNQEVKNLNAKDKFVKGEQTQDARNLNARDKFIDRDQKQTARNATVADRTVQKGWEQEARNLNVAEKTNTNLAAKAEQDALTADLTEASPASKAERITTVDPDTGARTTTTRFFRNPDEAEGEGGAPVEPPPAPEPEVPKLVTGGQRFPSRTEGLKAVKSTPGAIDVVKNPVGSGWVHVFRDGEVPPLQETPVATGSAPAVEPPPVVAPEVTPTTSLAATPKALPKPKTIRIGGKLASPLELPPVPLPTNVKDEKAIEDMMASQGINAGKGTKGGGVVASPPSGVVLSQMGQPQGATTLTNPAVEGLTAKEAGKLAPVRTTTYNSGPWNKAEFTGEVATPEAVATHQTPKPALKIAKTIDPAKRLAQLQKKEAPTNAEVDEMMALAKQLSGKAPVKALAVPQRPSNVAPKATPTKAPEVASTPPSIDANDLAPVSKTTDKPMLQTSMLPSKTMAEIVADAKRPVDIPPPPPVGELGGPKITSNPKAAPDTSQMSEKELFAHYRKTAPVNDLKRLMSNMPSYPELQAKAQAMLDTGKVTKDQVKALENEWRTASGARSRAVGEPGVGSPAWQESQTPLGPDELPDPASNALKPFGPQPKLSDEAGSIDPKLVHRLTSGALGAGFGAYEDKNNRLRGAAIGGAAGLALPSVVSALTKAGHVDTTTPTGEAMSGGASKILRMLPDYYRANLLMHPVNLPLNVWGGPWGSGIMGSLEHRLAGDPRGTAFLKNLKNSHGYWSDAGPEATERIAQEASRFEGLAANDAPAWFKKFTQLPANSMTQGDIAIRNMLQDSGFTADEARRMTLTNEPYMPPTRGITGFKQGAETPEGIRTILTDLLLPFYRTSANQFEQGMERIPGVGSVVQRLWKDNPDPVEMQGAQQAIGGTVITSAYMLGKTIPANNVTMTRTINKMLNNLGGQYGMLASAAFLTGQASQHGKSTLSTLANVAKSGDLLPLPTTQPLVEIGQSLDKLLHGKLVDQHGIPNIPKSLFPGGAMARPSVPGSVPWMYNQFTKPDPNTQYWTPMK